MLAFSRLLLVLTCALFFDGDKVEADEARIADDEKREEAAIEDAESRGDVARAKEETKDMHKLEESDEKALQKDEAKEGITPAPTAASGGDAAAGKEDTKDKPMTSDKSASDQGGAKEVDKQKNADENNPHKDVVKEDNAMSPTPATPLPSPRPAPTPSAGEAKPKGHDFQAEAILFGPIAAVLLGGAFAMLYVHRKYQQEVRGKESSLSAPILATVSSAESVEAGTGKTSGSNTRPIGESQEEMQDETDGVGAKAPVESPFTGSRFLLCWQGVRSS